MGNDQPPKLQDGSEYLRWKREVNIWTLGTSVVATKQAAICILRIEDLKARDYATRLNVDEIKKDTGLTYLLAEMDKYFKEDSTQCIFLAIEELENFKRGELSILEYISEFRRRVSQLSEIMGKNDQAPLYDDCILAYKMLVQADLKTDEVTLVKAAMGKDALSTAVIEECLKRCFGDKVLTSREQSASDTVKIKVEPTDTHYNLEDSEDTFYNNRSYRHNSYGARKSSYYKSKDNFSDRRRSYSSAKSYNSNEKPKNPEENSSKNKGASERKYEFNARDPKTGMIRRCSICESVKHLMRDCPHNVDKKVLFQSGLDSDFCETVVLVNEAFNKALIDTGASYNVCGEVWLSTYLDSLSDELKKKVKDVMKHMNFRFGDGKAVCSTRCVEIPVHLCGRDMMLETYVVPGELPFLLSRTSMKELGVSLDIENDKISMKGEAQDLQVTDSGHYVADLLVKPDQMRDIMVNFDSLGPQKTALKLHRYYGHPHSRRLIEIVKVSDLNDKQLIEELEKLDKTCEQCVTHRRDPPRPKSSMMTATDFNEVVCMDIKKLSTGDLMLHFIDLFSRFSTTCIVPNKHKDTIIEGLFKCWITLFGAAGMFFSDNGGEFVNEEFLETCESLDIAVKTTAANSPWSNGVCERHNGLIAESFDKIIEDVQCSAQIALAWATNAKNCLANNFGYSPYMLVFGKNPRFPGLDNVKSVTTLNESVVSKLLADHLNSMYQSRLSFTRANNSEKLKRALRGRVTNYETEYYTGDKVYFKKKNQKKWSGPATVIGKEGKLVFIRQGGSMFRVHVTKLVLQKRADEEIIRSANELKERAKNDSVIQCDQKKNIVADMESSKKRVIKSSTEASEDSSSDEEFSVCEDQFDQANRVSAEDLGSNGAENSERQHSSEQSEGLDSVSERACTEQASNSGVDHQRNTSVEIDRTESSELDSSFSSANEDLLNSTDSEDSNHWKSVECKKNGVLDLSPEDKIRYRSEQLTNNNWEKATVISSGGRVKSKNNKNVFNLKKPDDSQYNLHLEDYEVQKWETENTDSVMYMEDDYQSSGVFSVQISKERYDDPDIKKAMTDEMQSWKKYGVFKEVPDSGQKTLSTRWVVTKKSSGYKARLVIRGFEECLTEHVDSPTGDKCSTRIMLSLSKAYNWKVETMDIKAAFLQSQELDRTVHVKPPKNLKKAGVIWQLEKPAYGLNDSPRNWYNSLKEFLVNLGCSVCKFDPGLFYKHEKGKLIGLLLLHVDDFLVSGNNQFKETVLKRITVKYDVSKHIAGSFKYIGINISQNSEYITLDQADYCKNVKIVELDRGRQLQKQSQLTAEERTSYLSLLGKLSWLSYVTRPDLKFDVYTFSRKNKSPTVQDLMDLNGVVSKLKQVKCVRFPRLMLKNLRIVVFADASFGNLDDKVQSSRGYVIFLSSEDRVCCLTWAANKVSRVVSSTLESETLALLDGLNHAEWLRGIVVELLYGKQTREDLISIIGFTDSSQLSQSLYSTQHVKNHKLRRDIENIKERLANGTISEVRWIGTDHMLADPLTKKGADCAKLDYVLESGNMFKV